MTVLILAVLLVQIGTHLVSEAQGTEYECPVADQAVDGTLKTLTVPGTGKTFPKTCTIKFKATEKAVNLVFTDFKFGEDCEKNYIEVGNGDGSQLDGAQKFCGNTLPVVPLSTGDKMFIKITAGSMPPDGSLVVTYVEASKPTNVQCTAEATVVKLGEATTWPPRENTIQGSCTKNFKLQSQTDKKIQLQFSYFRFPEGKPCNDFYVAVGSGENPEATGEKYCGNTIPAVKVSDADKMFISIKADNLPWGNLIQFTGTEASTNQSVFSCQSKTYLASDTTQELTVPSADSQLPADFECTYIINAPDGKKLDLVFNQFRMGSSTTCDTEYVIIGEGENPSENEGKKLCGPEKPDIPVNHVPTVYVYVKGAKLTKDDGFVLSYKSGAIKPTSFKIFFSILLILTYQQ